MTIDDNPNVFNPDLVLLRDLIHKRTGLFFQDYRGLEVIASRLSSRLEKTGCRSFSEYYRLLNEGAASGREEWLQVVAQLAKPKSSFARHVKQASLLVDTVIPQWLSNGSRETLKIWSAGCSTGEEPLTIAMALTEHGWFDRIQIELLASDANFVAIEAAQRGVYGDGKIEDLSLDWSSKYFVPINEGWKVKPELHQRVQWSVTNIVSESQTKELATSDIIFCCNVFIYFSAARICQTLRWFGKCMPAGGYLFSDQGDYFESLLSGVGLFERQEFDGHSIWMKRNDLSAQSITGRSERLLERGRGHKHCAPSGAT
jgi:chemotaxis protein methyltransferase CheR